MTQPANLETVLDAIQRNADVAARLLVAAESIRQAQEDAPSRANGGGQATISINTGSIGIAMSVAAVLLALVVVVMHGQRISDTRIDMQTERLSREAMDNWTAQEVTAIRSYITNGKLQPMQPRPKRQPEPQQ